MLKWKRLPRRMPLFVMAGIGAPLLAAIPGGSLIVAIIGISFLIFVHEWGHYTACRLTGTRTETFSIGFGPRLFGWEKDAEGNRRFTTGRRQLDAKDRAMDFRFALIPLGGYVKMAGELPHERSAATADDEFPNKSAWARSFIISAGVIMNVITAFVLFAIAYGLGLPAIPPVIGDVLPGGGAWHAGLEPGDRITHIAGRDMDSFKEARIEIVHLSPSKPTTFTIQRGDQTIERELTPTVNAERGMLQAGFSPVSELEFVFKDRREKVGFDEPLTAQDGTLVRGGTALASYITHAVQAGLDRVVLTRAGGETIDVPIAAASLKTAQEGDKASFRVGLAQHGYRAVKSIRASNLPFKTGDRLVAFTRDGQRTELTTPYAHTRLRFGGPVEHVEVKRGDDDLTLRPEGSPRAWLDELQLEAEKDEGAGVAVTPIPSGSLAPVDQGVGRYPTSPAALAGIKAGERIVRVADRKIESMADLVERLGQLERPTPLRVDLVTPDGNARHVEVTPVALEILDVPRLEVTEYQQPIAVDGVGEALGKAWSRTGREIATVFRTIGALFEGTLEFSKNIAGPVTLISVSNRVAKREFPSLLRFLAYISVMLAVLNILPIPVLDGGHLVFILIEAIKGSPLSEKAMNVAQYVGMLLLLTLMFFALRNDIRFLFNPPV